MRSLLLLLIPIAGTAQPVLHLDHIADLPFSLNETSALKFIQGTCWTLNDGGHPNDLHQIDTINGQVLRSVTVTNSNNTDWEELAATAQWTYVGDFGNNQGTRTDLRIYRVNNDSLLDATITQVTADTISFNYADQTDFSPMNQANRYDMEAMVAWRDTLYLFTKDWVMQNTRIYQLPSVPGHHTLLPTDSLEVNGLITAADIDTSGERLVLLGHALGFPIAAFMIEMDLSVADPFTPSNMIRYRLQSGEHQMEGIAIGEDRKVWISNEQLFGDAAALRRSSSMLHIEQDLDQATVESWGEPYLVTDLLGRVVDPRMPYGILIYHYEINGRSRSFKVMSGHRR